MLNYKQVCGILVIVVFGILTLVFQIVGWFDLLANFNELWLLILGTAIGIGISLMTRKTPTKPKKPNNEQNELLLKLKGVRFEDLQIAYLFLGTCILFLF